MESKTPGLSISWHVSLKQEPKMDATADSNLVVQAANAAHVTSCYRLVSSPSLPQMSNVSPHPRNRPCPPSPLWIVCTTAQFIKSVTLRRAWCWTWTLTGHAKDLADLQQSSSQSCGSLCSISQGIQPQAECRRKIKRVITPVSNVWIDALHSTQRMSTQVS